MRAIYPSDISKAKFEEIKPLLLSVRQITKPREISLAQSVKNTDTAAQKSYDAGKKVSGIKRHNALDTNGLPHAVAITTAEVTDRKGGLQALQRCKDHLQCVKSLAG
jgi:hypothetical protein